MDNVINAPFIVGILAISVAAALYSTDVLDVSTSLMIAGGGLGGMVYGAFFLKPDNTRSSGKTSRHWGD